MSAPGDRVTLLTPERPAPRHRSRRLALFGAVAAVAAFLLFLDTGSGSSSATTPLGVVTWHPTASLAAGRGYRLLDVGSSDDGVLAVATSFEAAVWASADGTTWAPEGTPPFVRRVRLAAGRSLAIGQETALSPENVFRPMPRIWRRGAAGWLPSQVEPVDTIRWWIEEVVANDDAVLLVAVDLPGDRSWIWRSGDGGETFQLTDDPPFPPARTPIAATTAGFVAVVADRDSLPEVWESGDGIRWRPAVVPFPPGWRVSSIAARGDAVLVVGGGPAATRPDAVWLRDGDGSWAEVTAALSTNGDRNEFRGVAAGASGWVVYGTADSGVLWLSADGREWQGIHAEVIDGRAVGGSGVGEWSPAAAAIGGGRIALVGRRSGLTSDALWVGVISSG